MIEKKINTKKYPCDQDNSVKLTKCFNEFYMKKLNCSFPWSTNDHPNLTTCSEERIKNLVNLANNANIQEEQLMKEIEEFGCTIPNCETTNWKVSSTNSVEFSDLNDYVFISLNFPSSKKVKK